MPRDIDEPNEDAMYGEADETGDFSWMTTVHFAKLYSTVTTSSLWEEEPMVRVVFLTMLAKCDARSYYGASLPGLCRDANIPRDDVLKALSILEAPDTESRSQRHAGRRVKKVSGGWIVLNARLYRDLRTEEQIKAAERKRRQRERERRGAAGSSQVIAQQHDEGGDDDGAVSVTSQDVTASHRASPEVSTSPSPSPSVVAVSDKELRTTKKPVRREGAIASFLTSYGLDAPDFDGLFEHFLATQKSPHAVMARLRQHLDGSKKNVTPVSADELAVAVLEYMGKKGAVEFDARYFEGYVANVKAKHEEARARDAALARISDAGGSDVTTRDLNAMNVGWRMIQSLTQGIGGPPSKRS